MQRVAEALYIPVRGVANPTLGRYTLLKQDIDNFNSHSGTNNIVKQWRKASWHWGHCF